MAMPKKGSRNIVVDGAACRWRIRGRPSYSQEMGWSNLSVAIEPATEDGTDVTRLVVDTSAPRPDADAVGTDEIVSVTPAVVEAYIRLALKQGWNPVAKGKPFVLVADEGMVTGKD